MTLKCSKHPKYTGRKKPKTTCSSCASIYLRLHASPRTLLKPAQVFQSKKKKLLGKKPNLSQFKYK